MRVLALDYGSARCGCALSDPSGTIVTPIAAVPRPASKRGVQAIARIARETRAFAHQLEQALGASVPVEMHDERFTTRIASRMEGAFESSEDSRAAALLLESWLARASH